MHRRQPFSELNRACLDNCDRTTPPKASPPERHDCSVSSVQKNANNVLRALEAEESEDCGASLQLITLAESPATVDTPCRENSEFLGGTAVVDTILINRLASEIAAGSDVVTAWEQVEELRSQLRQRDADLQCALETIDQLHAEQPSICQSKPARPASAGQQLAQFLKEQLQEREDEIQQAHRQIASLQQHALVRSKEYCTMETQNKALRHRAEQAEASIEHLQNLLEAVRIDKQALEDELCAVRAFADEQVEATTLAKLELTEVRQATNQRIGELQQELLEAESLLDGARSGNPAGTAGPSQQTIVLQHCEKAQAAPETVFHSPPASPVSDVFGSPQQAQSVTNAGSQQQRLSSAECNNSPSFQFQPIAVGHVDHPLKEEDIDDGASSSADTDDTVSEAAVVARTMRRAGNICSQHVHEVSLGLQQLKDKQRHLHEQLAGSESYVQRQGVGTGVPQQISVVGMNEQSGTPTSVANGHHSTDLEEKCHFQQLEMKQLRTEVESLNNKCENSNQVLMKANQAIKILHYKLQKERKTVARLQDERCHLQSQLLNVSKEGAGPHALEQELTRARGQVEQLIGQKSELEARVSAMAAEQDQLRERQIHVDHLHALLEESEKLSKGHSEELARLSSLAHSSTEELLEAREELQRQKMKADSFKQEKAELVGKVKALQETLQGLGNSDNILLSLTEEKASLQLQLRDAETSVTSAQSTLAQQSAYVAELEHACQALRQQLDAATLQDRTARAAMESSSDMLQELLDSRNILETQLQQAQQQLTASETKLKQQSVQHALELQQERDAAEELAQQISDASSKRDELSSELQQFMAHNAELQECLQVQQAECSALRSLGTKTEADNQNLVDNMCNMTGLIDAVQALQRRNQLVLHDNDEWKLKYQELQGNFNDKCKQHSISMNELQQDRKQLMELQEAHVSITSKLGSAEEEKQRFSLNNASLHLQLEESRNEKQHILQDLQDRLNQAVLSLSQLTTEQQTWQLEKSDLQSQLASARKAQTMAQSKLVLAKKREAQLKEAAEQFVGLQEDIKHYLKECEAITRAKKESEERCALLENTVAHLEQSNIKVNRELVTVKSETVELKEANDALEQQLTDQQTKRQQLQESYAASQKLQQRLSHLESEHQSSAEWFDALTTELGDKTAQLAEVQAVLAISKQAEHAYASQVAELNNKVAELQQLQQEAELGWQAACAALQSTESKLADAQQQCHALEFKLEQATTELKAVTAAESHAAGRVNELEMAHSILQADCSRLKQDLEGVCGSNSTSISVLEQQVITQSKGNEELSARLEAERGEHQLQVSRMQVCVDDCMAMCDSLAADLAAAKEAWKKEEQQAQHASQMAEGLQEQLQAAEASITSEQAANAALKQEAAHVAERCEQLQQDCDNLSAKVAHLQSQQQDADKVVQLLRAELSDSQAQRLQLNDQMAVAIESRHCAQRTASEAAEAEQAAKEALARQSGELHAVRQHLSLAEERLQQSQSKAAEIQSLHLRLEEAERQLTLKQGRDDVKLMLLEVSSKLESQMEILKHVSGTASKQATGNALPASPGESRCRTAGEVDMASNTSQPIAWRGVLSQALEKIEALHAENKQLWHMVEMQLHQPSSQAAMLQEGHSAQVQDNLAAELAEAQDTIERLQQTIEHLRLQGGQQSMAYAGSSASQECKQPTQQQGTSADQESWLVEKRVLKAICKLALAVTMDQVGGRREALALSQELAPLMQSQEGLLHQLGLMKVWRSLYKLAVSCPPTQHQSAGHPEDASTSSQGAQLQHLQDMATHYKEQCKDLQGRLDEMEGAAEKWQGQATHVEHTLSLLRFQLEDLLSEVKWVLEDFSDKEPRLQESPPSPSHQLSELVSVLTKALRRLLRKHRTLSSLLASEADMSAAEAHGGAEQHRMATLDCGSSHQRAGRQHFQQRRGNGNEARPSQAAIRHAGTSSADYAARRGSSSSTSSALHERQQSTDAGHAQDHLVVQAPGKAASIAEKLNRMLDSHSRPETHGGSNRFLDINGTESAAMGKLPTGTIAGASRRAADEVVAPSWGASGLHAWNTGFGDEDIPLRQQYSSRAVS